MAARLAFFCFFVTILGKEISNTMYSPYGNIKELENKVTIPGPEGLLEGKMKLATTIESPIALIFHPHPLHGGTMNNKIVHTICKTFQNYDCHTLRINFRGVGASQGKSIGGSEELDDALSALDWFIKKCEIRTTESMPIWVAGFSFGGWIAMQAAMRRPEIAGFISISPPVETYHFNLLTPFPNGLIVQGENDHIVQAEKVKQFSDQLIRQKGCKVDYKTIDTDHYYTNKLDDLNFALSDFLDDHML